MGSSTYSDCILCDCTTDRVQYRVIHIVWNQERSVGLYRHKVVNRERVTVLKNAIGRGKERGRYSTTRWSL